MKYKKMLAVMLTTSIAASAVPMTAWAEEGEEPNLVSEATEVQEEPEAPQEKTEDSKVTLMAEDVFELQDFNLWGEKYPGWYNVGWKYAKDFDRDTITALEVGIRNPAGEAIVTYTADEKQVAWQKKNSYIAEQSSAPFYQEYDGKPIPEERGDDWTITKGKAFDKWNADSCYVTVTTASGEYTLEQEMTQHKHSYTEEKQRDVALKSDKGIKVWYKSCSDENCIAVSEDDEDLFCENLQDAIDRAEPGDAIELGCDITLEAGVENNINLNKAITIKGNGHTITRAFSSNAEYEAAFSISADNVTIENLTVKGTGTAGREDAAFYLGYGANENIRIENCKFEGTGENPASGIISAYGTADKLTVKGCEFSNAKYGMYFNGINNATIEGNKVQNTQYNGIYIADDTNVARQNVVIQNNTLSEIGTKNYSEQYGSGIYVEEATGAGDSAVQVSGNSVTLDSANDKGKPIVNGNSILVTSIELNQTTLSLRVGRTAQLKATVTPENATDKTVTWKSSDTSVATVDENGTVTAEGRGNATITASAGNGAEATCDVTVKRKSSSSGGSSSSSSTDKEYSIAIDKDIDNGKVKVDPSKAEKGDKVTITVTPDKGYEISKVVVKDADGEKLEVKEKGKDEYTFTMPDSKVEIDAKFVKAEEEKPEAPAEAKTIILTIDQKIANVFGEYVVNDVAPIIRNERTMLPIRFIAQNLGAEVAWDDALNKVTITKDDLKIELYINSAVAVVNGENVTLDAPAFIENSRTYLPLRFVAENLGATVTWDAAARQVTIQK